MAKHRKTESVSSQVHKSQSKPNSTPNGTDHISSEGIFDPGSGSDTVDVDSVLESITFNQGVKMAENFRKYYAAYDKEYEAQQATEAKGETVSREDRLKLLAMHKRLERMKQEINAASQREGL
jgi:RNA polymerase II elongation factor ELL